MKKNNLTPGEMSQGRRTFYLFNVFNVIAFYSVSGNILTLYALRLGADNFLIGLISSFYYLGTLFILFGRFLTSRMGTVKQMGVFWLIRYFIMIPLLAAPFLERLGIKEAILPLLIISTLGFNMSRGFAMAVYNPILGSIASNKQRGSFLSNLQIIEHTGNIAVSLSIAFFLGGNSPLYIYTFFFLAGIISGIFSARYIFKLPESTSGTEYKNTKLLKDLVKSLKNKTIRKFLINNLLIAMLITMVAPFIIVYMQTVYNQSDSSIIFFTIAGSLGAVFMALITGFLIDKLGAKPLYFYFTGILTLTLFPLLISPQFNSNTGIWIFASLVFFFYSMGVFGIRNSGQVYFFAAIKEEQRFSLGMIYTMSEGLAAGVGSLIGGILLISLQKYYSTDPVEIYRLYFSLIAVFFLILLFMVNKMESLGAYSIRHTTSVLFSQRDIKTISLLNRLDKVKTIEQEKDTIKAIAFSKSALSTKELLHRLKSPRLAIRTEALKAMTNLPYNEGINHALISDVKNNTNTTAYISAELIGVKGIREGLDILRKQLNSTDFFLSGKCMVALARLGDLESIPNIEEIVKNTSNARLIIHGAFALEIFHNKPSILILLGKLEKKTAPFLRDEIILSIAGIFDIGNWFYPIYIAFLERSSEGIDMLYDYIDQSRVEKQVSEIMISIVDNVLVRSRIKFRKNLENLLSLFPNESTTQIFKESIENPAFDTLDRLYFLTAAASIRLFSL